jgi:adenylate cyclase class 2
MSSIEVEIKFTVADRAALEQQLPELGFTLITPRTFERNVLYDTPQHTLRESRSILRIRQYGERWVLTHKCLPSNHDAAERHKHRVETETAVDDGVALATVFEHLGYQPSFVYEKYRTEYADATGHCVLDETPIGLFAELEGPEDWIDRIAAGLRLQPERMSRLSYGRLFDLWKQETGSAAQNLTFEEISPLPA